MSPARRIRRQAEKHFPPQTVNFWCHVVEGALAMLGMQIVGQMNVLPVLVSELGGSGVTIGLVQSLIMFAFVVPLVMAPRLEAARRRKGTVLLLGLGKRLAVLLVGAALLVLARPHPVACIWTIAALLLLRQALMTLEAPAWFDLIAETVPHERHGRLWGYRMFVPAVLGLGAAPLSAFILRTFDFPGNYSLLYLAAFGLMGMSWLVFLTVDDVPDSVPPRERKGAAQYFRALGSATLKDSNYRNWILFSLLRRAAFTVLPFFVLAGVVYHRQDKAFVVAYFMGSRLLGRIVGTALAPRLCERIGHKRVIQMGNTLAMVSCAIAAFAPRGWWWLFISAPLIWSLGGSARNIASMAYQARIYPRGRRFGYQAMHGAVMAVTGILVSPLYGLMMDWLGHTLTLCLAGVMNVAAVWPLEHVNAPDGAADGNEETAQTEADQEPAPRRRARS
jgi:MFS family permease